ncbi:MAG: hypothetical protein OEX12_14870 [Gammaproteobacteria bacterium]|nr:hypothetical protein [Gammaproteobacteria bacterium]
MVEQQYSVMIGACGWEHPAWDEVFYPDDLPEDWRMGFYSNEFPVLQLPLSRIMAAPEDELDEWLEDSHEGFRLVVELESTLDSRAEARLLALQHRLLALILSDEAISVPESLSSLPCLWAPREDNACELHLQAGRGQIWTGESSPCWDERLAIVCLQSGDYKDMKQLKQLLLSCAPALEEGRTLVLLFAGDPPDVQLMQNARTLTELLGF